MKRVLICGGSGFVGRFLTRHLQENGYEVRLLSRQKNSLYPLEPDGCLPLAAVQDLDAVINLSGETIGQLWSPKVKQEILSSRLQATERIVRSLQKYQQETVLPKVFVNASAIGYYGAITPERKTEADGRGKGFLAEVCDLWEKKAQTASSIGLRVLCCRFGVVLGPGGGMLEKLELACRLKTAGTIGSGKQKLSWIHYKDLVRGIQFGMENSQLEGAVNFTAPTHPSMQQFMDAMAHRFGGRSWSRLPAFLVRRLGGEMAEELLLADQQIYPQKLEQAGFSFLYPKIEGCLQDIYPGA